MILFLAGLLGGFLGYFLALKRKKERADRLHYAAVFVLLFVFLALAGDIAFGWYLSS